MSKKYANFQQTNDGRDKAENWYEKHSTILNPITEAAENEWTRDHVHDTQGNLEQKSKKMLNTKL